MDEYTTNLTKVHAVPSHLHLRHNLNVIKGIKGIILNRKKKTNLNLEN